MYFATNLTLDIRTKDLHSIVRSRRPVVVPTEFPRPKTMAPKLKVLEPPVRSKCTACESTFLRQGRRVDSCSTHLKFWILLDVWIGWMVPRDQKDKHALQFFCFQQQLREFGANETIMYYIVENVATIFLQNVLLTWVDNVICGRRIAVTS